MAKILILIIGHLCNAPRPQKEAETLANAGHEVTVRGFWFHPELVKRDRLLMANKKWKFEPILDFQPNHRFRSLGIRLQSRLAKEGFRHFGFFSPELLGYGVQMMLKAARQARADLTIVHSEAGLWVGNQLLNEGFRVGVDFEDWFSEDLLPKDRVTRPIKHLKALESRLARNCTYCLTTSHALAEALANAYQAPKPIVIYNTFPWAERLQIDHQKRDQQNPSLPSIHWFSQTIGPGRGLETLFQALPKLRTPVEIHLRGNYPEIYRLYFEPLVPTEWRHRLFIHPTVPNAELVSRIAEHDIGLAVECTDIPSRNLTVTNKLFQYLQAGLAVVASDTAGQQEIFSQQREIGRLIKSNNSSVLAQALNELLESSYELKTAKDAALRAAREQFCWEIESQKLVQVAEAALN
ncbi:MAG: glycosyltransferase [Stigonema ocellatum SAG 48.90 = DSM 106950]|nr:glycosyltransferase [Stigonema ocellatum SAG 48.90 = DSM 106950]